MARTQHTIIRDSLTGREVKNETEAEQVKLAIGETAYLLDLTADSRKKLEAAIAPFIQNEEAQDSRRVFTRKVAQVNWSDAEREACREWAFSNGHDVPQKGRIRKAVREAWEAAGKPMTL